MAKLRKILALVLVMAMTVTMLPVFAAADDVAVETVAPVAEAPAAEAPAAEDVAVVPAEPAAPAAAAIETVAAETVAPVAELQALTGSTAFETDDAALEEGYFLKLTVATVGTAYYNTMSSAATDITNNVTSSSKAATLTLLSDYTAYTATDSSTPLLNLNTTSANYVTIDLSGHVLTAQLGRPLIGRNGGYLSGITIKNGTILYQNIGRTTEYNGAIYSYASYPTTTGGTSMLTTSVKLNDAMLISLAHSGDSAKVAAAVCSRIWKTTVTLTDSVLIAEETPAVKFFPVDKAPAGKESETTSTLNKNSLVCSVVLNGDCAVGTLAADAAAVRMSYPATLQAMEGSTSKLQLKITPDSNNQSVFLGSAIASYSGDPEDATRFEKILPEKYTEVGSYSIALPDTTSFFHENSCAEDVQPGWLEPAEYPAIIAPACQHPNKAHVDAVSATYTEAGMAEHWLCPDCGKYFEADGVTETTADALVIPIAECPHAAKAHVDAVAPTYAAAGTQEHWYCADCGKYFTADGETETTLAALAGDPKLTDATGKTDAELVALGAVTKATAPDGSVTAYNGIEAAINLANTWTTSGGEVKLLRDYALYNGTNSSSKYYTIGPNTATYHAYDETIGDELYGYWIDLGGHAITVKCQRGFFGVAGAGSVNIKNGSIYYMNETGSSGAIKGLITFGISTTAPYDGAGIKTGRVTLYNAELVSAHDSTNGGTAKDTIYSSLWSNVVRLYDSKVISKAGSGVCFFISEAKVTDADQLADIQSRGVQNVVELHGDSLCGSLTSSAAIRYQSYNGNSKPDNYAGTYEGIDHVVTVTADGTSKFLSSSSKLVTDSSGKLYELTVVPPAGDANVTSVYYARPDADSFPEATTIDAAATLLEPAEYSAFYYGAHVHNKEFTDAVPATFTSEGCSAFYYCAGCGTYWEADGETVTTREALTIPVLVCTHEGLETHDAVAATYAAAGSIAYWYCPTCEKFFADDACTQEIAESDAVVAKLTDATGKTDDELVALGAVVKTVDPDGTAKAFDNIVDGYTQAKTWTEAGGELRLLKDYGWADDATHNTTGFIGNTLLPAASSYDNDEVPTMPTKGFWFDLGGHTLTAKLGKAMYWMDYTRYVNIKNGAVIYRNTARGSALIFGAITCGYTTSNSWYEGELYIPTVNLCNVEFYSLPALNGAQNSSVIASSKWNTTVNIQDSVVLAATNQPAIEFIKANATPTGSNLTAIQEHGSNYIVNVTGESIVGSTNETNAAIVIDRVSTSTLSEGIAHQATVTASEDTTFIGAAIAKNNYSSVYTLTTPEDFTAMPQTLTFNGADLIEQTFGAYVHRSKLPPEATRAVFTPAGGAESAEMTLSEAVQAWRGGRDGTIKLLADVSGTDAGQVAHAVGGEMQYQTSSSTVQTAPAMLLLGAEDAGGRLTLDLNGYTVSFGGFAIAAAAELDGFELTVKNGTLENTGYAALFLNGVGVGVTLDGVVLNAPVSGNNIYDFRPANGWSIYRNCSFLSAAGSNLNTFTNSGNTADTTLTYYVENCSFSCPTEKQRSFMFTRNDSAIDYREFGCVVNGDNSYVVGYLKEDTPRFRGYSQAIEDAIYMDIGGTVSMTSAEFPYSFATDTSATLLTTADQAAATVAFRDVTLNFKNAADALACAEKLGRCGALDVTVTLAKDVETGGALGAANRVSAFTLDLGGKALPADGLIAAAGGAGTEVTITVTGEGARSVKLFSGVAPVAYNPGGKYVIRKGALLESYSLNLEDSIKINLYADKDAASVGYLQDGAEHVIPGKDDYDAWVADTLAAKDMSTVIDVYAVKTANGETVVDFALGVSVLGYVASDPAAAYEGDFAQTLRQTLDTMLVYGKYAEKYFAGDYGAITPDELAAIGLAEAPAADVSNLTDKAITVTGMDNRLANPSAESGFYGTSAVLEDAISLKFYFFGAQFDSATATVNGEAAELRDGDANTKFVLAPIAARNFDEQVTVEIDGVGSVQDSAAGYTSRITAESDAYNVAQALRSYGASAMRFYAAKTAALG